LVRVGKDVSFRASDLPLKKASPKGSARKTITQYNVVTCDVYKTQSRHGADRNRTRLLRCDSRLTPPQTYSVQPTFFVFSLSDR